MKIAKRIKPECPDRFDLPFARRLVEYLGGDSSEIESDDCWPSLAVTYEHLREGVERYFEKATTGDPAMAAHCMVRYCDSRREWAEKVIEKAKTGDPAIAASDMVRYCYSNRKWGCLVVERTTIGNPATAAYDLARSYKRSQELAGPMVKWAEGVIEKARVGNPAFYAYKMARHCGSYREWAEKVIENAVTVGDRSNAISAAILMRDILGSSSEWASSVYTR